MDFMTHKPATASGFTNILVIIDEHSRFPFAFPTIDRLASTVQDCLQPLIHLFGPPRELHSDNGAEFRSRELSIFLNSRGIKQTFSTPYNPTGNGQVERMNGTLWKAIQCLLADRGLAENRWNEVLGEALDSIRSLRCTTQSTTPHQCLFRYNRRIHVPLDDLPMQQGDEALQRRYVRSKNEPRGDPVTVLSSYPGYAVVQREDGTQQVVNNRNLAKLPPTFTVPETDNVPDAPPEPAADARPAPPPLRRGTRQRVPPVFFNPGE